MTLSEIAKDVLSIIALASMVLALMYAPEILPHVREWVTL